MIQDNILSKNDKILILSPHPDDELLSSAGFIQKGKELNIPIKIVFITNGEGFIITFKFENPFKKINPENLIKFGEKRQQEAIVALNFLEIKKEDIYFLSFPDSHIKDLYYQNFKKEKQSKHTKLKETNYPLSYKKNVPYKGKELEKELSSIIKEFNPTKIFYPTTKDRHNDHRFTGMFLEKIITNENLKIETYSYLIHYFTYPMLQNLIPKNFIFPPKTFLKNREWININLSEKEVIAKKRALSKYITQRRATFLFFRSFEKSNELFIKEN